MTVLRVQNFQNPGDKRYLLVDIHNQNNYRLVERRELNVFERVALIARSFFYTLQAFFSKIIHLNAGHIDQTFLKAKWESVAAFSGVRSIFERHIPQAPQAAAVEVQQPPVQQRQPAEQPIGQQVRDQVQAELPQAPVAPVQAQPAALPPGPQAPVENAAHQRFADALLEMPPQQAIQAFRPPAVQIKEPIREQASEGDLPTTTAARLALRLALSDRSFAGGTARNSKYYNVRTGHFLDMIQHHNLRDETNYQKFAHELEVNPNLFLDRDAQIETDNSRVLIESCTRNIPKGYSRITIVENTGFGTSLLVRVTEMGKTTEVDLLETNYIPGDFKLHFSDRMGHRLTNPDIHFEATAFLDPDPSNEFKEGFLSRVNRNGPTIRTYLYK